MNGLPRFPAGKRNPMVAGVNRSLFRDELITSLLDTDAYKIHMMQVVFERYPTAWVKYRFHCRSQENLAAYADDVRQAILKLQRLRFSDDQLRYLRTRGEIKPAFVDYLKRFRFDPARHVTVAIDAGQLAIEVEGPWLDTILYEIPVLAIVSEIRNRRRFGEVPEEAIGRTLRHKVERLKTEVQRRGLTEFRFADFGTRRRFSYAIQREVVEYMVNEIPEHFAGTSNYHLAREFQLPAIGTMAHEFIMAHQALVPAPGKPETRPRCMERCLSRPICRGADRYHLIRCLPEGLRRQTQPAVPGSAPRQRRPDTLGRKIHLSLRATWYRPDGANADLQRLPDLR